ncbi:tyrosine-type recombinase/integrase [Klebsiella pneumoniae]|nr:MULTISPECIES: tyrosine-type recombinase/integrase [Klebsiella]MBC4060225.1 tyrosine-type recombinase/integrase [Klebsiella pneumoniae]MBK0546580.1 tyrosine-type recombinase/integrase [Klebsiella pneumoniae]MCJ5189345.1 tyrosine-type recombinase/integrase [Klebsiella variicola]MCM6365794.1 tyrosine-type recombinase/integrase [Klebsiella pneumoniae]MCM6510814.1 tyrosine-type recombinase/integrase [Klebsiella pneumoniae]
MPRPRKNKDDAWMPPRVYLGRSAYEYHPKGGGNIRLCDKTSTQAQVWSAWEALMNDRPDYSMLEGLIERFFNSGEFFELAPETQKDYRKYSKKIIDVFGKMPPDAIKPEHIRRYMDKRGIKSRTQANREKAFMSRVYRWAYERGFVKRNPTKGVRQYKEVSRDRYITNEEYQALYSVAPDIVKIAMELAYLCCARQNDVLEMKKSQFMEEGILIKQSKTSVAQIKAWSPRLNAALELAKNLPLNAGMSSLYVIHQPAGGKYTRDGFNSRWRKAKIEAQELYPHLSFDFTFHDLKAKGISDLKGNLYEKQAISGHKNVEQTARYDRKIAVVPVVDGQVERKNIMK